MPQQKYYTYILTNADRSVLYTGVTNNLQRRLLEHWIGNKGTFTTEYKVHYLLWFEESRYVLNAIAREKEIKDMLRAKKEALIAAFNPSYRFLNEEVFGYWPPTVEDVEAIAAYLRERPDEYGR